MVQAIPNQTTRLIELDDEGHRHWCPSSEKFAPADALIGAFERGWHIYGIVFRQEHWNQSRRIPVYHLKLERGGVIEPMVVIENPFITRLLNEMKVRVVRINERKQKYVEERW